MPTHRKRYGNVEIPVHVPDPDAKDQRIRVGWRDPEGNRRFRRFGLRSGSSKEDLRKAKKFAERKGLELTAFGNADEIELSRTERLLFGEMRNEAKAHGLKVRELFEDWRAAKRTAGTGSVRDLVSAGKAATEFPSLTLEELHRSFVVALRKKELSPVHERLLIARTRRFAEAFSERHPSRLSAEEIAEYLDQRRTPKGERIAKKTYNHERAALVEMFEFARTKLEVVDVNKAKYVDAYRLDGSGDATIWTPEETSKIFDAASPEWLPALALVFFAGLRPEEVAPQKWDSPAKRWVRWEDIDTTFGSGGGLEDGVGTITVNARTSKIRKTRRLPLQTAAWSFLEMVPEEERTGYICPPAPTSRQKHHPEAAYWGNERAKIKERSGLAWKADAARRSYVSYRVEITGSEERVAREIGDRLETMRRFYQSGRVDETSAKAYFSTALSCAPSVPHRKKA